VDERRPTPNELRRGIGFLTLAEIAAGAVLVIADAHPSVVSFVIATIALGAMSIGFVGILILIAHLLTAE
jgi:hypothetical protein